MSLDLALALAGFAFVMSVSPGPGNFLLLASGASFGLARSLPLLLGISFGFLAMVAAVGLGLGEVLERFPAVLAGLRIASLAYVFWLAWRIAGSRSLDLRSDKAVRPIGFIEAALLQLLNPKAWAVALIVTVSYTQPDRYLASLAALIALFAFINIPSIGLWALAGTVIGRLLSRPGAIAGFNIAMAALLVASMLPVALELF